MRKVALIRCGGERAYCHYIFIIFFVRENEDEKRGFDHPVDFVGVF